MNLIPDTVDQTIALDIGGVCLHLRPDHCAKLLGFDTMEDVFAANPGLDKYSTDVETGKLTVEDFLDQVSRKFLTNYSPADIKKAWLQFLGKEMDGMAELAQEMKDAGFRLFFLSDISSLHHQAVVDTLSFAHLVEDAVVSYKVGAQKPDPSMFKAFEKRCGGKLPALYFDDRACNIEGARARGWNAHHFTDVEGARKAFKELRRKNAQQKASY